MADFVTLHEVAPRDGLQNEPQVISVAKKLDLITALRSAGLKQIEVGAFVSPRWVPQMADTPDILAQLPHAKSVKYDVLIPNLAGWQRFCDAPKQGPFGIAVFVSASEGFSQANLNCTIAESVTRAGDVAKAALAAGVPVRGYVSCVTDCPYDGPVEPDQVASVAAMMRDIGVHEISLGDTIGKGTPKRVKQMLEAVIKTVPASMLAGHFHDTGGQAIDNIRVSLDCGVRSFDSAVGGLGGCPYAPGAPGNVATEQVVRMLHGLGYVTDVDEDKLAIARDLALKMKG